MSDDFTKYDEGAAKGADQINIASSGAFVALIEVAYRHETEKGAVAVSFNFTTESGNLRNIDLYVRKKDGNKNDIGYNKFQSLMTIFGLKSINEPVMGKVDRYGKEEEKPVYKQFSNKTIGIVMQKIEQYRMKKDDKGGYQETGEIGWRMELRNFFNAETKQMASEMIDKKDPKRLKEIIKNLRDIKVAPKTAVPVDVDKPSITDDEDDDLPF